MPFGSFLRALSRPAGIMLSTIALACALAAVLFVPSSQHILALILGAGFGGLFLVLAIHILRLTRWTGDLEQSIAARALELPPLSESLTRLDDYTHRADLNIGRIATQQATFDGRLTRVENGGAELATRLLDLQRSASEQRGFEVRLSTLESKATEPAKLEARQFELERVLRGATLRVLELERGVDRAGVRLSELEADALRPQAIQMQPYEAIAEITELTTARIEKLEELVRTPAAQIQHLATDEVAALSATGHGPETKLTTERLEKLEEMGSSRSGAMANRQDPSCM